MISIRNAKNAKQGLLDMIEYIGGGEGTTMVEIGCYVGDSTKIFAENFRQVYCIDPWENGYDENDAASYQHDMAIIEAQFNVEVYEKYKNVVKFKGKSLDMIKHFDVIPIDVVYIDGLHTYDGVKEDINAWRHMLKEGCYICGHDYQRKFQGVIDAVNEFKKPDKVFSDTSWTIKI